MTTFVLLAACAAEPAEIAELRGRTMGTSYSIKLSPAPDTAMQETLKQRIEGRLQALNQRFSTYIPDSELMQFNRTVSTEWVPVSAPLLAVVERAQAISEQSDGSYDITVGPLVNLWGFGSTGDRTTPPDQTAIAALLERIGYMKLHTRSSPPALRKDHPALEIDLSSIAKGWAVDQISLLLHQAGVANFLVEIGGETRTRGRKIDGTPWRIAIERPLYDRREIQGAVAANDFAIATSGDYRNFFRHKGRYFSHTIDPHNGQAIAHKLASVTVVADNCAEADAWATALMSLGEKKGPMLAESRGIKALFIIRSADGFSEQLTSAFQGSGLWHQPPP